MDKIFVMGMEFYGYHGVFAAENELGQRFRVDIECGLDMTEAGASDNLETTVSYADVYQVVQVIMEQEEYVKLLERLAHKIIQTIFAQFPLIQDVRVRIIKPDPPIRGHYEHVGVEMKRGRHRYEA